MDPVVLKRTIKQSHRRHASPPDRKYVPTRTLSPSPYYDRRRERSRSPMDYEDERESRFALAGGRAGRARASKYNDYDDPRRADEEEVYRRGMIRQNDQAGLYDQPRTMADRLDSGSFVSPLAGAKIQVSNLEDSVSQEDISELFGDIGALKRAKLVEPGVAEVVFIKKEDAQKAVEIYHNRQLDGKAMKCKLVGNGGEAR